MCHGVVGGMALRNIFKWSKKNKVMSKLPYVPQTETIRPPGSTTWIGMPPCGWAAVNRAWHQIASTQSASNKHSHQVRHVTRRVWGWHSGNRAEKLVVKNW